MRIGDDLELLPGTDAALPVRVRWVTPFGKIAAVAFWPDGRIAWRLVVEGPFIDELPPIDANGAIVCATSSCHVVVLDHQES